MKLATRVEQLPPYLFAAISRLIEEKRAAGVDVISFGIGDPDVPTPEHILASLKRAADDPANHRYPESDGLPELRQAIARWYQRRHSVELDPNSEIVPLIGSKEGIGHLPLCLINPGDVALMTDGRFSGGSHGFIVGHITPEAQEGGPIALVHNGDKITIDAEKNRIDVALSDEVLADRAAQWKRPPYKFTRGTLYKYIKNVKSASEGCVTDE